MSTGQKVVFDGRTIRFDAPVPSPCRLRIGAVKSQGTSRPPSRDEVIEILKGRPELPDAMRTFVVCLFECEAIQTFSLGARLGATARVDMTLADKDDKGRPLLGADKRIAYFAQHFERITEQPLDVTWQDDLSVTRRGGTAGGWFGNLLEVVLDAASTPLSFVDFIVWNLDD